MTTITTVVHADIPVLLPMIARLCTHHGDVSVMDAATAEAKFIDGPLVAYIARNGTMPAGYCVLEPRWRPTEHGDLIDIAHLFVEGALRGQGIGRAMIAKAADHARRVGACRLVIGTAPDNPNAARIYRAMGLAEITTHPGPRFEIAL